MAILATLLGCQGTSSIQFNNYYDLGKAGNKALLEIKNVAERPENMVSFF